MKVETFLLKYLEDENLLSKKIEDRKLEFGFVFSFPPGLKKVSMQVVQPKQEDFIIMTLGIQIPDTYIKALNSLDLKKKNRFYFEVRKFLLQKNFLFSFDLRNFRYQISDQIYLTQDIGISKNDFFHIIRKIYNAGQYCNMLLGEYCSANIETKDLEHSDDLFGPNFYS